MPTGAFRPAGPGRVVKATSTGPIPGRAWVLTMSERDALRRTRPHTVSSGPVTGVRGERRSHRKIPRIRLTGRASAAGVKKGRAGSAGPPVIDSDDGPDRLARSDRPRCPARARPGTGGPPASPARPVEGTGGVHPAQRRGVRHHGCQHPIGAPARPGSRPMSNAHRSGPSGGRHPGRRYPSIRGSHTTSGRFIGSRSSPRPAARPSRRGGRASGSATAPAIPRTGVFAQLPGRHALSPRGHQ